MYVKKNIRLVSTLGEHISQTKTKQIKTFSCGVKRSMTLNGDTYAASLDNHFQDVPELKETKIPNNFYD